MPTDIVTSRQRLKTAMAGFSYNALPPDEGSKPLDKQAISTSFSQWSVYPNDTFAPSGPSREILDAGVFRVEPTNMGPVFIKMHIVTDELIALDDAASDRVLESMKNFWDSKEQYTKRGILYKRGVLLEGPAGSGKTSLVNLLMQTLVSMDGIVLICGNPTILSEGLSALRRIEPDRNIICVFEDLDELTEAFGEHKILSVLDGEHQVSNVVHIATTNFPEKLGARICNRPSRFDERIRIDMPTASAREKYIRHITRDESIPEADIQKWIADTDGFSVAHIRELAVAIFCLKQPYDDVLGRLKEMQVRPKSIPEFKSGFGGFKLAVIEDE